MAVNASFFTSFNVTLAEYDDVFTNPPPEEYTLAERVVIGVFLGIVIFIAIIGNILVCVAVFTERNLRQNSNFFIVSLAIADLLVAGVVMTFAVVNDITGKWYFGSVFCLIWISSDIMCSTASILNLCAISLDRFIHIRDPLKYERFMTTNKTMAGIAFIWLCSTFISFLPIHLGWHKPHNATTTSEQFCSMDLSPEYAVISSIISFYIPCIVMIYLYVRLYLYARRHVKYIKRMQQPDRLYGTSPGSGNKPVGYKVSDHKARVTLGVIMGVFLLCWSPFFLANIIYASCHECIPSIVFTILIWLGYVNSALNPLIYSIFNQEFRSAFRKIIFLKLCAEYSNDVILRSHTKRRENSKDSSNSANAILKRNGNNSHPDIKYQTVAVSEKVTSL